MGPFRSWHPLAVALMPRKRLLTPGPTQVPELALAAMARQVEHHRTREFRALLAKVLAGLKYVFQTANDVVLLSSSGTGAMEAAVVNLVPRGGKAIVLESGVFSRRWADLCVRYGIDVVRHVTPWGQAVHPDDVAALTREHRDAVAVFGTLMESSTGVAHDVQAIGQAIQSQATNEHRPLWVVDGISGVGCVPCLTDEWGIDVLVVGSQKALMTPPGLAFVSVSDAAWQQIDRVEPQAFYFDLKIHRDKLRPAGHGEGPDTPWTPAHTLIAGLAESLRLITAEGLPTVWARADLLARATRAGITSIGLAVFAQRPAAGMTSVRFPDALDGPRFLKRLDERFGVKLAGGQGPLKGKIFRMAHFGMLDELDMIAALAAIELVLDEMGQSVLLGSAAAAASRVIAAASAHPPAAALPTELAAGVTTPQDQT
jgi:aspartate aminotransferase-like enzyme